MWAVSGMPKRIAIVGTLDTKGPEVHYLKELIEARGFTTLLVDASIRGDSPVTPDYNRAQVSERAGVPYERLLTLRRDEMMRVMGEGAAAILADHYGKGDLHGALAVGGNQGTAIAGIAMRALPYGFPKLIVSTVASGNIRPYVGSKDIAMMFSVADVLGGPNSVTRAVLANAAGAITGMASMDTRLGSADGRPSLAITAFGNTNAAVVEARRRLEERGYEVIAFHASGACGTAMEDLIDAGTFAGVLDLTTHELVGEVFGDDIYTPVRPGRLTAATRAGIPLVVAPGGLDYFCFAGPDTIPERYRNRKIHYHNPYNTNVRTTVAELETIARVMAERLNSSTGPVTVLIPLRGWSENGRAGGPLHEPDTDAAFVRALKASLDGRVRFIEVDANINDPVFAARAAEALIEMMDGQRTTT